MIVSLFFEFLNNLYYKSATLCFFSKVLVTKINTPWIDEAPRGLNKKQYSHGFTPLDKDISFTEKHQRLLSNGVNTDKARM